jgi:hypothetical protein
MPIVSSSQRRVKRASQGPKGHRWPGPARGQVTSVAYRDWLALHRGGPLSVTQRDTLALFPGDLC